MRSGSSDGTTATSNWADFPGLGYEDNAIYISSNQYTFGTIVFQYAKSRVWLSESVEALGGGREAVFAVAAHLRRGGLEGFLRGDAFEPAVQRKLFVVGKIQPHEDANLLAAVGLFRRLAVELEYNFLAQSKGLLPAFQLVTRLLGRLFVRSEIEDEIRLRHEEKYIGTRT